MDSFINLNEYENPANMTLNRMVYDIPNTVQKRAYHRVRNAYIYTDSGILFEDQKVLPILQVESMTADVVTRDYFFSLVLAGNRVKDVYYRRYIKVQDIMAYAGGLFRFIFLMGNIIFFYINQKGFQVEIFNKCYTVVNIPSNNTPIQLNESKKIFEVKSGTEIQSSNLIIL
jgi:hypothetical protein